jgi:light-regulated signal transduction histidine kinase (bacteriophytochrome)
MAQSSADHLLTVINDILDFSKIEAGEIDLDAAEFDIRRLETTVKMLAARAHQKGIEMRSEVAADVPDRVVGDPHRLAQVLVNLIGNSLKFTEAGRVSRCVTVDGRDALDTVMLRFSCRTRASACAGTPGAHLRAVPAGRRSTTRRFGGTGLGASISVRIVNRMGGRLWLESEVSKGSTFSFTTPFPISARSGVAPLLPAPTSSLRPPWETTAAAVLLAEDNPVNQALAAGLLPARRTRRHHCRQRRRGGSRRPKRDSSTWS